MNCHFYAAIITIIGLRGLACILAGNAVLLTILSVVAVIPFLAVFTR